MLQEKFENALKNLQTTNLTDEQKHHKEVLKVIIADFQRRPNLKEPLSDDKVISIVNKFIKNNIELYSHSSDKQKEIILEENTYLKSFLPKGASEEEIKKVLESIKKEFPNMNNGQLTGAVIKHFKSNNIIIDGKTVQTIINS